VEAAIRRAAEEAAARAAAELAAHNAAVEAWFLSTVNEEPQGGEEWGEEEWWGEEGVGEYASYHPHAENGKPKEAHAELVSLYRPLTEGTNVGLSESEQSEGDGHYREVSGDGCGDGGYCKGHWVKRSEHGHRHGEPIGGDPWFCETVGSVPASPTAEACWGWLSGRFVGHGVNGN
jgi:hypothetical protein